MGAALDRLLRGPYPALPRPVDALSERWARLRPRARLLVVGLVVIAVGCAADAYVRGLQARWGGPPATVLVATRDLNVGQAPARSLRAVQVPPPLAPPGAVLRADPDAVLALALPEGTVLTDAHVEPRGPAAGLSESLRVVPIPVEAGWGVTQGAWVDVWTLGSGDAPARHVASTRPVVGVREDASGLTALVGLEPDAVEAVTAALALGRVLLTHSPAPDA